MNSEQIYFEDASYIAECKSIEWDKLNNSTILVTGATGLIGSSLVRGLLFRNKEYGSNIKILALVRSIEKFTLLFNDYISEERLIPIVGDIRNFVVDNIELDYIVHGASVTASSSFVSEPVETIMTAVDGTRHILEIAKEKRIKGMIYLSSMEVYGKPYDKQILTEDQMGYLDPISVRSSYSESKKLCETLCVSFASEYLVPVKIVRLTQTFGPGVEKGDKRVFADFASCIMERKNIVLLTKGESARMYLYTADAGTAILTVLTKGKVGEAYNAANIDTYCSVKDMACLLIDRFGDQNQQVIIAEDENSTRGFNPIQQVYLNTDKLCDLGWTCNYQLIDMYNRMMICM